MKITKIVVPTDFSEYSLWALERAKAFASQFGAEIVLVHVVETPIYPTAAFGVGAADLPAIREEVRTNLQEQLDKLVGEHFPAGKGRGVLRDGIPFAEILETAEQEKADLIVIATHGHTGIKHLLLGSTAEKVVRKAHCPVMTVRQIEAAA